MQYCLHTSIVACRLLVLDLTFSCLTCFVSSYTPLVVECRVLLHVVYSILTQSLAIPKNVILPAAWERYNDLLIDTLYIQLLLLYIPCMHNILVNSGINYDYYMIHIVLYIL